MTKSKFISICTVIIMTDLPLTVKGSEATATNFSDKIMREQQILGVQCRLIPNKYEWQTSEVPTFKAYINAPGNNNLRLAEIINQGCQIQLDNKWYRYINFRWTGGTSNYSSADWLAQAGGYIIISLNKGHWVTIEDSNPLVLEAGNHTISFGWAGYKEDPTDKNNTEKNPVLLVSEPVQIRINKSEEATVKSSPTNEHTQMVQELFYSYTRRQQLTEDEKKLGLKTDLLLFEGWLPKFYWEDIPVLLELAKNDRLIQGMTGLSISSYIGKSCREGMVALWFIEGLRHAQNLLEREIQLKENLSPTLYRLPFNPFCVKEDMELSKSEQSLEIYKTTLQAYLKWWNTAGSLPAAQAAAFYPLDLLDINWYGGSEHWPEEPLEIYKEKTSDGIVAERIIRHLNWNGNEYQPDKILQTVYYTLINPEQKAPFTPEMLKVKKIVLRYYDKQGTSFKTGDILLPDVREPLPFETEIDSNNVIREAIGKQLNKDPKELIGDDYLRVDNLALSGPLSDLHMLIKLPNLRQLDIRNTTLSDISPLSELAKLEQLTLAGTKVSDIRPLSNLTNLQDIDLCDSPFDDISTLSKMTNLKRIHLAFLQIRDIKPLSNLTNLTSLNLAYLHKLEDIKSLSNLANLSELVLQNMPVSDIHPISNLLNLQELNLSALQIKDINDLANLTNLQKVKIRQVKVSDIRPLAHLKKLKFLSLNDTPVTDLRPLMNLIYLENLEIMTTDLSIRPLRDISPLANLTNLYYLSITNNQVEDISVLVNFKKLIFLQIQSSNISDLSPLKELTSLQELYFSNTHVSDIKPIVNLTNLRILSMSNTKVKDIGILSNFSNLQTLYLSYTNVSDEQVAELKKALSRVIISR